MTATLSATGFNQATFDAFLDARSSEPAWLVERRREAWERFTDQAWPTGREEQWMRTDIRLFRLDKFPLLAPAAPRDVRINSLLNKGVELAGSLAIVDNRAQREMLSEGLAAKGVVFGEMSRIAAEQPDLVRRLFDRELIEPTSDKFASLNSACWSSGVLMYVPKKVRVELPLHVLASMSPGGSDLSRSIIWLEEGAEATVLMENSSLDAAGAATGLHSGVVELVVGRDAKLRYVNLQNWGLGVWHFGHKRAAVDQRGQLQWTVGALGSRLAKVNQEVMLTGSDAEAQVNGVMFAQGKQHLCYNTHQHHLAPYCKSDLLYKTALQDESRSVWRGMIKVDRDAQRTDAYQRNDNLLLATTARADSIPGLEIEADDVRCTHGSTSGRVDEHLVFYAMARGYTRKEAVRMIVTGFFQQVFDRITIDSVREALGEAIGRRVRDLGAPAGGEA